MSLSEPATSGKVLFNTNYGPLLIELWCKEAPQTCKAFIQLCLEGFYDNAAFNRLVPEFIVQTGGNPKKAANYSDIAVLKEKHSRLKFSRRGLVASAVEEGNPFGPIFFTLNTRPIDSELAQYSLFGRLAGDTVYNLVKIGEVPVKEDGSEGPEYPITINNVSVLEHPFNDIIVRDLRGGAFEEKGPSKTLAVKKDRKLLSFGSEQDEDEEDASFVKIKSSHDVLNEKKLSKKTITVHTAEIRPSKEIKQKSQILPLEEIRNERLGNVRKEIENVKQNIKGLLNTAVENTIEEIEQKKPSLLAEQLNAYTAASANKVLRGKRKKSEREQQDTLNILHAFKSKLSKIDVSAAEPGKPEKSTTPPCFLHSVVNCKSCRNTFGQEQISLNEDGWLSHKLVFDKDADFEKAVGADPLGLIVIDPLKKPPL